jgi:NitT/TauT family transport system permease protein
MIRVYRILPHLVFIALVILILSPSVIEIRNPWVFFGIVILIEAALIMKRKEKAAHDIALLVFLILLIWEAGTTKVHITNTMLYPAPENVFAVFIKDWRIITKGIGSSLGLLFTAFFFALLLSVPLGIATGWFERPRTIFLPIAKVISPIPPIIYSPYAIGLLPSFRAASLFIIFSGIFWPVFINMVITVSNVDRRIMESAKTIKTKSVSMFLHILFPYCLPRIFSSMNVYLSTAFMILSAAELIGASSGVGWYVKYHADFANYTKVVTGIIVIGIVITALNKVLVVVQKFLIRWE